ncbi:glycoside hydrolase family 3 N-terminal domain-containing protein [Saxibacter everestensis]|uniref:Glycoside hydrolase family 3 N-terminal domain-containing protein n=1 Tax=Saxibacter everestensis TaxID=2909229 RepID=A0ABY8R095_9MICO|nr:glycoside hydrolase family 3 N-terminal domain-containing protein [Brevibacteriaceae bacterium ZFBP1038]
MTSSNDPQLRRLVYGVIWPGFIGTTVPAWLSDALADGLAGVLYFSHNIDSERQLADLSRAVHQAGPQALIGIDEEGGTVTRLDAGQGSFTPGNAALGRIDDVDATRAVAAGLALRLREAGIDINLAPVADVNVNPANPVIGLRSFGASTELVARHTVAASEGFQSAGIAACAKHFPGHGDVAVDSHLDLPVTDIRPDALAAVHLPPFRAAVGASIQAVLTAHIRIPAFGELPATLNPDILRLLRDDGFTGVIISDALDMAAIRHRWGAGPGAVLALQAGVDLLCVGNPTNLGPKGGSTSDEADFHEVADALFGALDDGSLDRGTLERATARLERLRNWLGEARAMSQLDRRPVNDGELLRFSDRALRCTGQVGLTADRAVVIDSRLERSIVSDPGQDVFIAALAQRIQLEGTGYTGHADTIVITDAARPTPEQRSMLADVLVDHPTAVLVAAGPESGGPEGGNTESAGPESGGESGGPDGGDGSLFTEIGFSRIIECFGASRSTGEAVAQRLVPLHAAEPELSGADSSSQPRHRK